MAMSTSRPAGGDGTYKPMAEINVTPFVDVMLVLLIIFMVAAPLMITGVHVDLPRTSAAKVGNVKKPVVVTLTADGGLSVRDESVTYEGLPDALALLRAEEGDGIVYVRADRNIDYGQVMDLLGRVSASGYAQVSLIAQAQRSAAAQ